MTSSSTESTCALILCYYQQDKTLRCLRSLQDQGIRKVILLDNSADPDENRRSRSLCSQFPDSWIDLLIADSNLGFSRGMNHAWTHARQTGTWNNCLILNNDIEAHASLTRTMSAFLRTNTDIAMVSAATETRQGPTQGLYYHRLSGLQFRKPRPGCFYVLPGHCLMLRTSCIPDPLFHEDYFMYGEDVELNWRMKQQGYRTATLPDVLLHHNIASSSRQGTWFYEYHVNRGHALLARDLAQNPLEHLFMIAIRMPVLMAKGLYRSIRHRSIAPAIAALACWIPLRIKPARPA